MTNAVTLSLQDYKTISVEVLEQAKKAQPDLKPGPEVDMLPGVTKDSVCPLLAKVSSDLQNESNALQKTLNEKSTRKKALEIVFNFIDAVACFGKVASHKETISKDLSLDDPNDPDHNSLNLAVIVMAQLFVILESIYDQAKSHAKTAVGKAAKSRLNKALLDEDGVKEDILYQLSISLSKQRNAST